VVSKDTEIATSEEKLLEPIFGRYQVIFPEDQHERRLEALASSGGLLRYWNLSADPAVILESDSAVKFISGYVPKYGPDDEHHKRILHGKRNEEREPDLIDEMKPGEPKTLDHIAFKALNVLENSNGIRGVAALGVLKADVDYLGLLMGCGLKKERFTVSRLATLSRQLNYFFTVYLPHLLGTESKFQDVYTVFAGGDDLFLIGPWNRIIDLAVLLRQRFSDYVCKNPDVQISAGISLHKPHAPIDVMAREAGEALDLSKEQGRDRLTLFGETVRWEMVGDLLGIRKELEEWLDKGWVSEVLFYRLNDFIRMAAKEQQVVKDREVKMEDMACTKWRALLVYTTERNVARNLKGDQRKKVVATLTAKLVEWLETYQGKLRIPLWDVAYNRR